MLRIAGIRTEVEVLGSENMNVVSIPSSLQGLLPPTFRPVGQTALHVHPDLWSHEILSATSDEVLGYLLMCAPGAASQNRFTQLSQSPMIPNIDDVYKGFRPGEEHWIWLSGGDAWPDAFRMRGREYPTHLDDTLLTLPGRVAHPIDAFNLSAPSTALATGPRWEVFADLADPSVGFLSIDNTTSAQRWLGRPQYLHNALIPPGPDGTWTFQTTTATPTPDFVRLVMGELPTIDLGNRTWT